MKSLRSATGIIAVLTILVSLVISIAGWTGQAALELGLIPARLSGVNLPGVPAWLTPFTCTIVHGGTLHLFFNMLMLAVCGIAVERVLGAGPVVVIYLVSAFVAALAQWAVEPMSFVPVIGASGAISGLVGAYALIFGRARQVVRSARLNRLINTLWLLVAWAVLQIAFGYVAGTDGVLLAIPAHIGGFLAGLLLQRPLLLWKYRSA